MPHINVVSTFGNNLAALPLCVEKQFSRRRSAQ